MKIYMDEAWRGPLYGPLHIGIVSNIWISEKLLKKHLLFQDSKALTPKKREEAFFEIMDLKKQGKILCEIGTISSEMIDTFWVTRAINLAVIKALYSMLVSIPSERKKKKITIDDVKKLVSKYEEKFNDNIELIFDWKSDFWIWKDLGVKTSRIVHWDASCVQIAMASILAKVSRDHILDKVWEQYPNYWFEKHKGYWTKLHYAKIEEYWILPEHRKLFLKKIFPERKIQKYNKDYIITLS